MTIAGLSVAVGGQVILRGVGLELPQTGTLALVGASGSGKTTLLRACLGLLPPGAQVEGQMLWREDAGTAAAVDLNRMRAGQRRRWRRRWVGYIPQEPAAALDRRMRVGDLLREAGSPDAGAALQAVGLEAGRAREYPFQWSGGMQQRLLAAMAVARRPRLLLADEPTSALDPLAQADWLALMQRLQQQIGFALVWVTHDLAAAAQLADRTAVLDRGQMVASGGAAHLRLMEAQPAWP